MGIQDKIFDVEHALGDSPMIDDFKDIMEQFYVLERKVEIYERFYNSLNVVREAVKELDKEK